MTDTAVMRIVVRRRALTMILPSGPLADDPQRGDDTRTFVVFDHSAGDPPRQLTITVRETYGAVWQMMVYSQPPASGSLLLTIGTRSFLSPFGDDGTATIYEIPAALINDADGPDLELAILPTRQVGK